MNTREGFAKKKQKKKPPSTGGQKLHGNCDSIPTEDDNKKKQPKERF